MNTKLTSKKAALYSLVASLGLTGLLGIAALVIGTFGELQQRILLSSMIVSIGSILALSCGAAIERGVNSLQARIGFVLAWVAAAMWFIVIWAKLSAGDFTTASASVFIVATGLALLSLLDFAKLARKFSWVTVANRIAVATLCALLLWALWIGGEDDPLIRLIGIASIVVTVLTISTPVLHYVSLIDGSIGASTDAATAVGDISTGEQMKGSGDHAIPDVVNLQDKLGKIKEYWHPHIVAELNGQHVKLAKVKGEFDFHHHENEDELFLVLDGEISLEFETGSITLQAGESAVVPRGISHRPVATEEAHILLFEPATTLNTGNVTNDRTLNTLPHL